MLHPPFWCNNLTVFPLVRSHLGCVVHILVSAFQLTFSFPLVSLEFGTWDDHPLHLAVTLANCPCYSPDGQSFFPQQQSLFLPSPDGNPIHRHNLKRSSVVFWVLPPQLCNHCITYLPESPCICVFNAIGAKHSTGNNAHASRFMS
jgi:hypothetical protein